MIFNFAKKGISLNNEFKNNLKNISAKQGQYEEDFYLKFKCNKIGVDTSLDKLAQSNILTLKDNSNYFSFTLQGK